MGFGDKFKKLFESNKKEYNDLKSQNNENKDEKIQFNKKHEEGSDELTPARNFKYLDDLIHSGVKEIVLDTDIVFDKNTDHTITIQDKILLIDGNGYTIDGNSISGFFKIIRSNIIFKNTFFKNGFATHNGSINCQDCVIAFDSCSFINNVSELNGGAVYGGQDVELVFKNCLFDDNYATLGGAIAIDLGELKINNCRFINNNVSRYSAAIYVKGNNTKLVKGEYVKVKDDSSLICKDSTFENNPAGGIWCRGNLKVVNVSFKNNGFESGSAINSQCSLGQNHERFISNCIFDENGILTDSVEICDSQFLNCQNEAVKIAGDYTSVSFNASKIYDSYFSNNSVAVENSCYLNIQKCSFNSNRDVIINNDKLEIYDSVFGYNGQAIANFKNTYMSVFGSKFTDSSSLDILNNGAMNIYNSEFNNFLESQNLIYQNDDDAILSIDASNFKTNCKNPVKIVKGQGSISNSGFELYDCEFAIVNNANLSVNNLKSTNSNSHEIFIFNDNVLRSKNENILKFTQQGKNGVFKSLKTKLPNDWKGFDYLNNLINDNDEIFIDCDIIFHEAEYEFYAGGIELSKDNLVIDGQNHKIDANHMSKIFHVTGNNIVLKNIRFVNGFDFKDPLFDKGGGALYNVFKASVKLINCEFIDNESETVAGAIKNNGEMNIENTLFKNNIAVDGGALINSQGVSRIINCEFESNKASNGGAIRIESISNASIINSTFRLNSATNGGAVINLGNLDIINTSFISNKAFNMGGAIDTKRESKLNISNCKFQENSAIIGGGINTERYAVFSIDNSCFKANSANQSGAIYDSTDDSRISNCSYLTSSDKIKYVFDD